MNFKQLAVFGICFFTGLSLFAQDKYIIDTQHVSAVFKIKHLGLSYVHGRFNDISGHYILDEKKPKKNEIYVKINANSIDTNSKKRDEHLLNKDYFYTQKHPDISFKSTKITFVDKQKIKIKGIFKIRSISKEITIDLLKTGEGQDPWGNYRTAFNTSFTIKRSDFGMSHMLGDKMISDNVHITFSVEGIRSK